MFKLNKRSLAVKKLCQEITEMEDHAVSVRSLHFHLFTVIEGTSMQSLSYLPLVSHSPLPPLPVATWGA